MQVEPLVRIARPRLPRELRRDCARLGPGFGLGLAAPGGSSTPAFTPTQLPGLRIWVRADRGVTLNGSTVSAWADQSGAGDSNRNFTQATGALQPTFNAANASYNGKPTITFSGSTLLKNPGAWASGSSAPPWTIYAAGNVSTASGSNAFLAGTVALTCQDPGGSALTVGESGNLVAPSGTLNTPSVICWICDGASSSIRRNALTPLVSGTASGSFTDSQFAAGNFSGGGANALDGPLAELIVCVGHHAPSTVAQGLSYMGAEYAITIGP